jgi:hypothetical protein
MLHGRATGRIRGVLNASKMIQQIVEGARHAEDVPVQPGPGGRARKMSVRIWPASLFSHDRHFRNCRYRNPPPLVKSVEIRQRRGRSHHGRTMSSNSESRIRSRAKILRKESRVKRSPAHASCAEDVANRSLQQHRERRPRQRYRADGWPAATRSAPRSRRLGKQTVRRRPATGP